MDRKEKANEKYRRLFYERGLDKCFEYIAFESKDHIRVKCKQCGAETIRAKDAFVGRQTRLICKGCKSGSLLYSDEIDRVIEFYEQGHSVVETCERYGIKKTTLNDWVKRRRATNGRTWREGGQECNKARAEAAVIPGRISRNLSYYARAKMRGAPAEIGITLSKLIKRDGGICQICGLPCFCGGDYLADLYPTIDHIVPLSKGGGHTWNNVQLAHRVCNINKSNMIGEEWNNVG